MDWGLGDTVLVIMLAVLTLGCPLSLLHNYVANRREDRLIQAAQSFELGEGVTLLQGVLAYYGREGFWMLHGRTVVVQVGPPSFSALCLDTRTWKLGLSTCDLEPKLLDGVDPPVDAMIQAVKDRGH